MKYSKRVYIVTRKHLSEAIEKYPDAANEIAAWVGIVEAVRWRNFAEVRTMFKDADNVDDYVIFNIRHNRYRLVTSHPLCKDDQGKADGRTRLHPFFPDAQGI